MNSQYRIVVLLSIISAVYGAYLARYDGFFTMLAAYVVCGAVVLVGTLVYLSYGSSDDAE